jgi:hypothetical protein
MICSTKKPVVAPKKTMTTNPTLATRLQAPLVVFPFPVEASDVLAPLGAEPLIVPELLRVEVEGADTIGRSSTEYTRGLARPAVCKDPAGIGGVVNRYAGVLYDGSGRMTFGSAVPTVLVTCWRISEAFWTDVVVALAIELTVVLAVP